MTLNSCLLVTLTSIVLASILPNVSAHSLRCKDAIVSDGMTSAQILKTCGEPDLIKTSEKPVFAKLKNGNTIQVGHETTLFWFYDRGPDHFVARLTIQNSIVTQIEFLDVRDIKSVKEN